MIQQVTSFVDHAGCRARWTLRRIDDFGGLFGDLGPHLGNSALDQACCVGTGRHFLGSLMDLLHQPVEQSAGGELSEFSELSELTLGCAFTARFALKDRDAVEVVGLDRLGPKISPAPGNHV